MHTHCKIYFHGQFKRLKIKSHVQILKSYNKIGYLKNIKLKKRYHHSKDTKNIMEYLKKKKSRLQKFKTHNRLQNRVRQTPQHFSNILIVEKVRSEHAGPLQDSLELGTGDKFIKYFL